MMYRDKRFLLGSCAALALLLAACSGDDGAASGPGAAEAAAATGESASPAMEPRTEQARGARSNQFWWPEQLDLAQLRDNEITRSNPLGDDFNYAEAFSSLDLGAVRADVRATLTDSQDWWPADYGHYGPFFIRMAWHSAGTYRISDGRGGAGGGQQRFEPLNSWPDNGNLDKARRLLWPVKAKYGEALSWADLMVLAGDVSMQDMGFETLGFAGGREDDWRAEMVYWGPEAEMLASERFDENGEVREGLGASQMGLIYVNPEGPGGNMDPIAAAERIRQTFGAMAMNDREIVALIAGGHTFGKAHGAHDPAECVGGEPAANGVEAQGMGWENACGSGVGADATTSGLEGAWTSSPVQWTHQYLTNLFAFEWVQEESPAGAKQWVPAEDGTEIVPDAHREGVLHKPIMFTTDLSMREDPAFREIALEFRDNPEAFEQAFAEAWFKLTHRDMGPRARYLGADAPEAEYSWQDPAPERDYDLVNAGDIASLKAEIIGSGLTVPQLVRTAWASASTYRDTDMRGGANGARIRLAPQNEWTANNPAELGTVLATLEEIRSAFNDAQSGDTRISLADLIVLGGAAAIEKAAADAGHDVTVPFTPGRTDASAEQTDVESFEVLEPTFDAFRNYYEPTEYYTPSQAMVEKADLLDLTVPQMTALLGGMRALDANVGGADHGVFTDTPGQLTNDFFVNLLDMGVVWGPAEGEAYVYEGRDRSSGELVWTATETDLVFGSNAELRAVAEVYATERGEARLVEDFVDAWVKVMQADRFDLRRPI